MNRIKKLWPLIIIALLFSIGAAHAAQNSLVLSTTSPYPGITMLNDANAAYNTLVTNNSGSAAPSVKYSDMFWADTTNKLLKFSPDATNFYPIGYFNGGWTVVSSGFKQLAIASTGSANAYVVTYSPAPTVYATGQIYSWIANFQNTGAATVNANSLGALPIKKQGNVALGSGDIANGAVAACIYDGTNCQLISETGNAASGSITSIATNNGVCGGTITSSGTISLCTQAADSFMGNNTGSTAVPTAMTQTQATALINTFSSSLSGAVPASGGGTTNFMRADGSWAAPTGAAPIIHQQTFTSGGIFTAPSGTASTTAFRFIITGGGSSGGDPSCFGQGAGGGAGGTCIVTVTGLTAGTGYTVNVGAGGSDGSHQCPAAGGPSNVTIGANTYQGNGAPIGGSSGIGSTGGSGGGTTGSCNLSITGGGAVPYPTSSATIQVPGTSFWGGWPAYGTGSTNGSASGNAGVVYVEWVL